MENLSQHPFELSISNCYDTIKKLWLNEQLTKDYMDELYKILEKLHVYNTGNLPPICDLDYIVKLGIRKSDINKKKLFDIGYLNNLVCNFKSSYVTDKHHIVHLNDDYIITPEKFESQYYKFLCLHVCLYKKETHLIPELLSYHLKKHQDCNVFCNNIKTYYRGLPREIKDTELKEEILQWIETANQVPTIDTRSNKLKPELGKYGFFELKMVLELNQKSKDKLIQLIAEKGLPYTIAMFDYIEFLKHLEKEHFTVKSKLNKLISTWFDSDKDGRAVKGNINSLSANTAEDKKKYTAHQHTETVKGDYQNLLT